MVDGKKRTDRSGTLADELPHILLLNEVIVLPDVTFSIIIVCNLIHPLNGVVPKLVTEVGIVTDVRPLQTLNTPKPICFTELGIIIDAKLVQLWNALIPILVIVLLLEKVTDVRLEQPLNALDPIDVIFPAMVNALVILLQLLNA